MPALLAYLTALVVFLGGSYEALTWLALPEHTKVVAHAKRRPPAAASESNLLSLAEPLKESASPPSENLEQDAETQASQSRAETIVNPVAVTTNNLRDESNNPSTNPSPAIISQNVHSRSHKPYRSENSSRRMRLAHAFVSPKRKLQLMTLETIEFADGRRAKRLVPYRGEAPILAFSTDW